MPKKVHDAHDAAGSADLVHDQHSLERLVFFSDAVFAIAITLLALDIRLPASNGDLSNAALTTALLSIWPKYLAYIISFLVIGSYWVSHHRKFRFIRRYDKRLVSLNMLLLMFIAFIPFPTTVLSEYGNQTATYFYAIVMIAGGLISTSIWWYASRNNRLIDPHMDVKLRRKEWQIPMVTVGIFVISIGIAYFNPNLARLTWFFIAIANVVIR